MINEMQYIWVLLGVKSLLILTFFLLLVQFMAKKAAETRYILLLMSFLSLLLLPIAQGLFRDSSQLQFSISTLPLRPAKELNVSNGSAIPAPQILPRQNSRNKAEEPIVKAPKEYSRRGDLNIWSTALFLYGFISIFIFAFDVIRATILNRRISKLPLNQDRKICRLVNELKRSMGIYRTVKVHVSKISNSPWTWGMIFPCIVIPDNFHSLGLRSQKTALLHELTHIQRFDQPLILVSRFCCAIYWINPLIWIAHKKLIIEAEKSCDDRVLNEGTNAEDYADQLLSVAKAVHAGPSRTDFRMAMAETSSLSKRIYSILNNKTPRKQLKKREVYMNIAAAITLVIPLALINISSHASPKMEDSADINKVLTVEQSEFDNLIPIIHPAPTYPKEALSKKIEGYATVQFDVDPQGNVVNAKLFESEPKLLFDEAALAAAYKFTYVKPVVNGQAAYVTDVKNRFNFRLGSEQQPSLEVSDEALKTLDKRAMVERDSTLHFTVAKHFSDRGQWENALVHMLRAVELGTLNKDDEFNWILANVLYENGLKNESVTIYRKIASMQNSPLRPSAEQWIAHIGKGLKKDAFIRNALEHGKIL